jgi:hypothetical protein
VGSGKANNILFLRKMKKSQAYNGSESEDLVEMYRLWRMAWSWPANTSVFGTNELGRHSWEDSDGDE